MLEAGSLAWVEVPGGPPWPGIVTDVLEDQKQYKYV